MEEDIVVNNPNPKNNKFLIGAITLLAIGLVFYYGLSKSGEASEVKVGGKETESQMTPSPTMERIMAAAYKDGTYTVNGNYVSHAGDESIQVKIVLKDNIITDSEVIANATNPMSQRFQGLFIGGYKQYVIGKNINDVLLDKVSGSSLTPIGFNDALEKIKATARV